MKNFVARKPHPTQRLVWLLLMAVAAIAPCAEAQCTPDETKPIITLLGEDPVNVECDDLYTDAGATALDNCDGDITANIIVGGDVVNTAVPGMYVITYNVSDAALNAADEVTRMVNVADTLSPAITLLDNALVVVEYGDAYVDAGAEANDACDGDLTTDIVIGGDTVDTGTVGTYIITYNVSDSSANAADEVTRTVNVANTEESEGEGEPTFVIVPNILGRTQLEAQAILADIGLGLGEITRRYHQTVPAGQVLSQKPSAGLSVSPGTAVAITVSDGPPPKVVVPNVVGMTRENAEVTLKNVGLAVGAVTQQSSVLPVNQVLSQMPAAGDFISQGALVSLLVSCGAKPARPEGFTASGALASIHLRWTPNTEEQITHYQIYRRMTNVPNFSLLLYVEAGTTYYEDNDVTAGVRYHYVLTAVVLTGDGILESDYAGPVSATAGAVLLRFGDVDFPTGDCGMTGIDISNLSGYETTGFEIAFTFDPDIIDSNSLQIDATAITRGLGFSFYVDPSGSVIIRATPATPFPLRGEGRLFAISLCIRDDASDGLCSPLKFTSAAFTFAGGNVMPTDFSDTGLVCVSGACGFPGDVNNNTVVTPEDAHEVLDIDVGNIQAEPCHWKTAELTGDRRIDCADAVIIMRTVQGNSILPSSSDNTLADRWSAWLEDKVVVVSMPDQISAAPGEEIEVPVTIENAWGLAGFGMTITFPPDTTGLTFEQYAAGTLLEGFASRSVQRNRFLRMSMASNVAIATTKADDPEDLILLRFRVAEDVALGTQFPLALTDVKIAGEFGEDFDWYANVVLRGGTIIVNERKPLCDDAAIKADDARISCGDYAKAQEQIAAAFDSVRLYLCGAYDDDAVITVTGIVGQDHKGRPVSYYSDGLQALANDIRDFETRGPATSLPAVRELFHKYFLFVGGDYTITYIVEAEPRIAASEQIIMIDSNCRGCLGCYSCKAFARCRPTEDVMNLKELFGDFLLVGLSLLALVSLHAASKSGGNP